jgi:regulator of CtrA degradation
MTDLFPAGPQIAPTPDPDRAGRIIDFAKSELFARTFSEGMSLVEESAAFLDGPGRALSKRLSRTAALAYAGESMRLTTRLMQVASWLLVQRAVREGDMSVSEAEDDKYRFAGRDRPEPAPLAGIEELPVELEELIARSKSLYDRVRRLDETMYAPLPPPSAAPGVNAHLARLKAAFGDGQP